MNTFVLYFPSYYLFYETTRAYRKLQSMIRVLEAPVGIRQWINIYEDAMNNSQKKVEPQVGFYLHKIKYRYKLNLLWKMFLFSFPYNLHFDRISLAFPRVFRVHTIFKWIKIQCNGTYRIFLFILFNIVILLYNRTIIYLT